MPHTIAENLTRLIATRTDIADAIVDMGGTVTSGDGLEEFPYDISTISGGGGGRPLPVGAVGYISFGTSDSNTGHGTIEVI